MWTHHNANHGGFIFAPEVGLHENVHELDLTSLYPTLFIRGASRQTLS
ncbi:DNA polymerase I [Haloarcula japonica DSM 6131]|uniref:DNA polymerase I n=1 Tax=Haloarcula japonica (strain ATCC 49778 / DSM 6131 / JCM 7785 / NBRC 101032 / NCIMB 13157 / TR-1) TaxID=1227453 RepID=M0LCR1_HALJT|nr:DNA polymerase I [Haloarcula japonica DSM 6131]